MDIDINEIIPGLGFQSIFDLLLSFFLMSLRLSAFMIASPLFGANFIMVRVRVLMSMVITLVIFLLQPVKVDLTLMQSAFGVILIFKEIAIGATAGLILNILFATAALAGEKIATSAGLSYAAQVDPVSGVQTPVVSQILSLFLLLVFLSMDGHLIALRMIMESYSVIPIGTIPVPSALIAGGMEASGSMFLNAAIIMLPIIIVVLLINVAIGIITRSAPQLNLFSFGFPITMLGTFIMLYLALNNLGLAFSDLIKSSLDHVMETIKAVADG